MAPELSNAENACCYNLCNTFWDLVAMYTIGGAGQFLCNIWGSYDCAWLMIRGFALEPPYVKSWNRFAALPGDAAVYGQFLPRKTPIEYDKFYNARTDKLGVDFGGQLTS